MRTPMGEGDSVKLLQKWWLPPMLVCLPSQALGTPSDTTQQAIVHFNAGNEAFSAGDTHGAYREYHTAWKLNRTFDIACNLGRTEAELGKLTAAAEHLGYCLDNFSASPQPELKVARRRYQDLFRTVTAQVSRLDLLIEPSGAEVLIDGESAGSTPIRGLYLTPGQHSLEIKKPNHASLHRQFSTTPGEHRQFELTLTPLTQEADLGEPSPTSSGSSTTTPSRPARDAPETPVSTRQLMVLGGAALTMVSAGIGVGYFLQAEKLEGEASDLRQALHEMPSTNPNQVCLEPSADCQRLADTVERQDRARDIAAGGFVAMGALGLGTLATWLFWPDTTSDTAVISPMLGNHGFGAVLWGRL